MEITWYGRTCIRLRGKDAVVVTDPYQSVVGPTGRGITGDIVTFSHPDDRPLPKAKGTLSRDGSTHLPSSLDDAFVLDGPGEYEVKEVLVTGVRTYRDDPAGRRPARACRSSSRSTESTRSTWARSAISCRRRSWATSARSTSPASRLGGTLSPTKAAALIAQLDPRIVVPMPLCEDEADCAEASPSSSTRWAPSRSHSPSCR